ncbi:MAG TPA: DUF5317 domain-containing protein [Nitriliruptorales bacterium]|nr:DUF5317 domain-containing protein [Nitriliruptorales bacterium]
MAFTPLVVVVAVALGYARGGRLRRIADADLGWGWLLFAGLALQIAVDLLAARGLVGWASTATLLLSQVLVAGWIVANRYRPGMPLILLGLVSHAVVIAANGAMPVDPEAIAAIGLRGMDPVPGKHELMTEATRLAVLGDVLPLPPLRTVISVGDVVLAAGLIPLVHHLMTYRSPAERRGAPRRQDRAGEPPSQEQRQRRGGLPAAPPGGPDAGDLSGGSRARQR